MAYGNTSWSWVKFRALLMTVHTQKACIACKLCRKYKKYTRQCLMMT